MERLGGTSHGQDATTVATTTGLGALIGAAADWAQAQQSRGSRRGCSIGAVL